jgi:hypothetical protein
MVKSHPALLSLAIAGFSTSSYTRANGDTIRSATHRRTGLSVEVVGGDWWDLLKTADSCLDMMDEVERERKERKNGTNTG